MNKNESRLNNVFYVSKLDLRVDHINGSSTKINKTRNMDLSEYLTLFDVPVPDFNVNLLYVHKLCKDNKCQVVFDEFNCVVHDS